jgi:hypothetical protein
VMNFHTQFLSRLMSRIFSVRSVRFIATLLQGSWEEAVLIRHRAPRRAPIWLAVLGHRRKIIAGDPLYAARARQDHPGGDRPMMRQQRWRRD